MLDLTGSLSDNLSCHISVLSFLQELEIEQTFLNFLRTNFSCLSINTLKPQQEVRSQEALAREISSETPESSDYARMRFVLESRDDLILPPVNLLQTYNRTRALICIADFHHFSSSKVLQDMKEFTSQAAAMNCPSLLLFTGVPQALDAIPESAIALDQLGYEAVEAQTAIIELLKSVYAEVKGECDILHALPEDSLICTEDDEVNQGGGNGATAEIPLKGIFTYEEVKTEKLPETTPDSDSRISTNVQGKVGQMFRLKQIDVLCESASQSDSQPILVPAEYQQKMRRRKFGRQFKLIADLAILLGTCSSPQQEATQSIEVALQELKAQQDYQWLGYGHETKAACTLVKRLSSHGQQSQVQPSVQSESQSTTQGAELASTLSSLVSSTGSFLLGPPVAGKDLVYEQISRALKLFRRCKMIECELEMQFKLIEYFAQWYRRDKKADICLKMLEQMRLVHDQVAPLLDDDFCEGVVLSELATVAGKMGILKRKEVFYRYLALKKFEAASESDFVLALFHQLANSTRTGYADLITSFQKRDDAPQLKILHKTNGTIEEVAEYLRRTFQHKIRHIDQFPFSEDQQLIICRSNATKMSQIHLKIFQSVLTYLIKETQPAVTAEAPSKKPVNSKETSTIPLLILFMLENFQSLLSSQEQAQLVYWLSQTSTCPVEVYLRNLPLVIQLKPIVNIGLEKKKAFVAQGKGDLFIVGPWVKKAGGADLESMRQENGDNMNAHLNWHVDDVLEFALRLLNPLKVELPVSKVELYRRGDPLPLASATGLRPLKPGKEIELSLKFRSNQEQSIAVSHVELTLFENFKTSIELDASGLNPLNDRVEVSKSDLYVALKKPYFFDLQRLKIEQRAPSLFVQSRVKDQTTRQLDICEGEKFTIEVVPTSPDSAQFCPYTNVTLQILAIHKDFRQKGQVSSDSVNEEFLTYPTADVCFEDQDFLRFFQRQEAESLDTLLAQIKHEADVFGYVVRLKYSKTPTDGDAQRIDYFSKPIVFSVANPARLAPLQITQIDQAPQLVEAQVVRVQSEMEIRPQILPNDFPARVQLPRNSTCFDVHLKVESDQQVALDIARHTNPVNVEAQKIVSMSLSQMRSIHWTVKGTERAGTVDLSHLSQLPNMAPWSLEIASVRERKEESCESFLCLEVVLKLDWLDAIDRRQHVQTELLSLQRRVIHQGCLRFSTQESSATWPLTLFVERSSRENENESPVSLQVVAYRKQEGSSTIVVRVKVN